MMNEESDLIVWFNEQLDRDEAQAHSEEGMGADCGWLPWRVLEEIVAKRRILSIHTHFIASSAGEVGCGICAHNPHENVIEPEGWCATVRWLAAPLNARAGYRNAWAPKQVSGEGGQARWAMGVGTTVPRRHQWHGRRI